MQRFTRADCHQGHVIINLPHTCSVRVSWVYFYFYHTLKSPDTGLASLRLRREGKMVAMSSHTSSLAVIVMMWIFPPSPNWDKHHVLYKCIQRSMDLSITAKPHVLFAGCPGTCSDWLTDWWKENSDSNSKTLYYNDRSSGSARNRLMERERKLELENFTRIVVQFQSEICHTQREWERKRG